MPLTPQLSQTSGVKSASAYKTISEVSESTGIPAHVLRFWESKFQQIRPLKRGGGRRYYRPEDVAMVQRVRALLQDEGYTIKGVQKLLKDSASSRLSALDHHMPAPAEDSFPRTRLAIAQEANQRPLVLDVEELDGTATTETLKDILAELRSLKSLLKA